MSRSGPDEGLLRIASDTFSLSGDVHRVITFLNQSLKDKGFLFGLTKAGDQFGISIYTTKEYVSSSRASHSVSEKSGI